MEEETKEAWKNIIAGIWFVITIPLLLPLAIFHSVGEWARKDEKETKDFYDGIDTFSDPLKPQSGGTSNPPKH